MQLGVYALGIESTSHSNSKRFGAARRVKTVKHGTSVAPEAGGLLAEHRTRIEHQLLRPEWGEPRTPDWPADAMVRQPKSCTIWTLNHGVVVLRAFQNLKHEGLFSLSERWDQGGGVLWLLHTMDMSQNEEPFRILRKDTYWRM